MVASWWMLEGFLLESPPVWVLIHELAGNWNWLRGAPDVPRLTLNLSNHIREIWKDLNFQAKPRRTPVTASNRNQHLLVYPSGRWEEYPSDDTLCFLIMTMYYVNRRQHEHKNDDINTSKPLFSTSMNTPALWKLSVLVTDHDQEIYEALWKTQKWIYNPALQQWL